MLPLFHLALHPHCSIAGGQAEQPICLLSIYWVGNHGRRGGPLGPSAGRSRAGRLHMRQALPGPARHLPLKLWLPQHLPYTWSSWPDMPMLQVFHCSWPLQAVGPVAGALWTCQSVHLLGEGSLSPRMVLVRQVTCQDLDSAWHNFSNHRFSSHIHLMGPKIQVYQRGCWETKSVLDLLSKNLFLEDF